MLERDSKNFDPDQQDPLFLSYPRPDGYSPKAYGVHVLETIGAIVDSEREGIWHLPEGSVDTRGLLEYAKQYVFGYLGRAACVAERVACYDGQLGSGRVVIFGHNAIPNSSPEALKEFSLEGMNAGAFAAMRGTPEHPARGAYMDSSEQQPAGATLCSARAIVAGTRFCSKGFQFPEDIIPGLPSFDMPRVSLPSQIFCPSNRANGCAERTILHWWLPLVTGVFPQLQETVGGKDVLVQRVEFFSDALEDSDVLTARITCASMNSHVHESMYEKPYEVGIAKKIRDRIGQVQSVTLKISWDALRYQKENTNVPAGRLYTSVMPCMQCAESIVGTKNPLYRKGSGITQVVVGSVSRHMHDGVSLADADDLHAAAMMDANSVAIRSTLRGYPVGLYGITS